MGLIERGDIDAVYAMGSTSDRKSVIDFTHPVRAAGNLKFWIKKNKKNQQVYMRPLLNPEPHLV